MRIQLTLLLLLGWCMTALGQWSIGPKVSYGFVSQSEQDIRIIPSSNEVPPVLRFLGGSSVKSVGVMLYNNIGPGFLQFEALGTRYIQEYSSQDFFRSNQVPTIHEESRLIVELPVTAGVNFLNDFKIGLGPVMELLVDKNTELRDVDNYVDTESNINTGFQGLLGYKAGKVHIDVRYLHRFASVVDNFTIGNDILKQNKSANRITLSVGITFGSGKPLVDETEVLDAEEQLIEF